MVTRPSRGGAAFGVERRLSGIRRPPRFERWSLQRVVGGNVRREKPSSSVSSAASASSLRPRLAASARSAASARWHAGRGVEM